MIHLPTAFFIFGALAFLFAIKMAADGIGRGESAKVLLWWCTAFFCLACAGIVAALRPVDPSGVRSGLPSFLLLVAFALTWRGIAAFTGTRAPWPLVLAGPLIWIGAWSAGLFADDAYRLILVSVVVIGYMLATGHALFFHGGGLRSARQAGCVCFFHAGVQVLRIATILWLVSPTEPVRMAGFPAILFVFEAVLVLVALGYLFLSLSRERGEQMLLAAAQTDSLTGTLNRRGFADKAQQRLAAREDPLREDPLREDALLLCDLDHFNEFSDINRHGFGDEALTVFCRTAESHLGAGDLIGRLGGAEFAILLVGTDRAAATRRADSLRQAFEAAARNNSALPAGLTVSIGLSSTGPGRELENLLRRADNALHRAKARGRNRVVSADDRTEDSPAATASADSSSLVSKRSSPVAAG
ncbi:hypothetical protein Sa4125_38020 [Aureimonas sp. SA4125]|uniref:GGDEF domain-containing protein n=1 Tax=Aureimonas sp. SA4125 TaxID=2826993 RepID=UPI001CC33E67|nr:GGDEF domain-containing protein [Aureimonas sp. SA4125]BDA86260.1 hypothetical protein Sa4125_38020 [Aureimonas sp. SA4125]